MPENAKQKRYDQKVRILYEYNAKNRYQISTVLYNCKTLFAENMKSFLLEQISTLLMNQTVCMKANTAQEKKNTQIVM